MLSWCISRTQRKQTLSFSDLHCARLSHIVQPIHIGHDCEGINKALPISAHLFSRAPTNSTVPTIRVPISLYFPINTLNQHYILIHHIHRDSRFPRVVCLIYTGRIDAQHVSCNVFEHENVPQCFSSRGRHRQHQGPPGGSVTLDGRPPPEFQPIDPSALTFLLRIVLYTPVNTRPRVILSDTTLFPKAVRTACVFYTERKNCPRKCDRRI